MTNSTSWRGVGYGVAWVACLAATATAGVDHVLVAQSSLSNPMPAAVFEGHRETAIQTPRQRPQRGSISLGLERMTGDNTYQIGGAVEYADGSSEQFHFPISELVFPLDVFMLRLQGQVQIGDAWSFEMALDKNLTTDAGDMEDSDWSYPGLLTIYSESDAELDAVIADPKIQWACIRRKHWTLSAAGGIRYEDYSYDISNTRQSSILPGYSGTASGLTMTYDLTYVMPYIEIAGSFAPLEQLTLSASLGYSPWLTADDDDAHLARSPQKFSEGSYTGNAIFFSLRLHCALNRSWFLEGGVQGRSITADGEQDVRSGAETWTIDAELESTQVIGAIVTVGRTF